MQKVLVAEIGTMTTKNPLLLGQGLSTTKVLDGDIEIGLRQAVTNLENEIGPVGSLGEIPFYVTISLPTQSAVQEVSELVQLKLNIGASVGESTSFAAKDSYQERAARQNHPPEAFVTEVEIGTPTYRSGSLGIDEQYILDAPGMREISQIINGRILLTPGAIMQAAHLISEEVGDVLVIDVGSVSTDVYSVTLGTGKDQNSNLKSEPLALRTVEKDLGVFSNALTLVKLIGENVIELHHGQGWEKLLKSKPESSEEMALCAELTAAAVSIALQRHIGRLFNDNVSANVTGVEGRDLTQIRWIVGTGEVLTRQTNGLKIMRESIKGVEDAMISQEGIALLLDKDCLMASLGVLTTTFRQGVWQLLRESFGVEN